MPSAYNSDPAVCSDDSSTATALITNTGVPSIHDSIPALLGSSDSDSDDDDSISDFFQHDDLDLIGIKSLAVTHIPPPTDDLFHPPGRSPGPPRVLKLSQLSNTSGSLAPNPSQAHLDPGSQATTTHINHIPKLSHPLFGLSVLMRRPKYHKVLAFSAFLPIPPVVLSPFHVTTPLVFPTPLCPPSLSFPSLAPLPMVVTTWITITVTPSSLLSPMTKTTHPILSPSVAPCTSHCVTPLQLSSPLPCPWPFTACLWKNLH